VLPALLSGTRGGTGGRISGLFLQAERDGRWRVMLEARGRLGAGESVDLGQGVSLRLSESLGGGAWLCEPRDERTPQAPHQDPAELLGRVGATPLPPYIRKARQKLDQPEVRPDDASRYNTVFAEEPGSVAAPTASLHFTPELLDRLVSGLGIERASLTLHVGFGTFSPIRSEKLGEHEMHREWMSVPQATLRAIEHARAQGRPILPVGTTSVRALESLPVGFEPPTQGGAEQWPQGYTTDTGLFIRPPGPGESPFRFRFTDALMTNFHLPRSSLLAMIAAIPGVGLDRLKGWYAQAIRAGYRFYSYGDAMLLL
jgi:S-adenosylmethionine:tRNA ribosyltransferase-isomerase